jgi:uncharacterized membrane protein
MVTSQGICKEEPVAKVNIGRLTNAIFVFTLLLLFTNIRIPTFGDVSDTVSPHHYGFMQLPDILSFLTAFLIIGMIWILAFHTFHLIARVDRTYLYLHLAALMLLMMIPASCHYSGAFPEKSVFPVIFHSIMLLLSLLLYAEWHHISTTPSVLRRGITGWQKHCLDVKMTFLPVTAIAGIVLAMLQLPFTQYIYYGTMVALALVSVFSWRNLKEGGASCKIDGGGARKTVGADTGPDSLCKGIVPHDMFEILVNGVFAFVMTLILKNNLPLPHISGSDDWIYLAEYFSGGVFGDLVSFLFIFTIFAIFYILFFEMLNTIRALDRYFVYLTFGFILALIFMPLTSLLYAVTDIPAPYGIAFHANVLAAGIVMILLWKHASARQRLLYPATDPARRDSITVRLYLFPATAVFCLLLDLQISSYEILPETVLYIFPCLAFYLLSRRC